MIEFDLQIFRSNARTIVFLVLSIFYFQPAQAAPVCSDLFNPVTVSLQSIAPYAEFGQMLKKMGAFLGQAKTAEERSSATSQIAELSNNALDFIVEQVDIAENYRLPKSEIAAVQIGSGYLLQTMSDATGVPLPLLIKATTARIARLEKPVEKTQAGFQRPTQILNEAESDDVRAQIGFGQRNDPLLTPYGRETELQLPEREPMLPGFHSPKPMTDADQNAPAAPIGFGSRTFNNEPTLVRVEFHAADGMFHIVNLPTDK